MAPSAEIAQPLPYSFEAVKAKLDMKQPFLTTLDVSNSELSTQEIEPRTIDELIRSRAKAFPDEKILGYPDESGDYVEYTYNDLDTYAFRAAQHYAKVIPQRTSSNEKERVVGLLGTSNLDYLITALALSKLGLTVLFLSTRISPIAYQSLLENTSSEHILADDSFLTIAEQLRRSLPNLTVTKVASISSLDQDVPSGISSTRLDSALDLNAESKKFSWIIHSSGSTGLPKPIYQTHHAALTKYVV